MVIAGYRVSKVDENRHHVISLGSCTRCHGDMHVARDVYGEYNECLQCGNTVELPSARRYSNLKNSVPGTHDVAN